MFSMVLCYYVIYLFPNSLHSSRRFFALSPSHIAHVYLVMSYSSPFIFVFISSIVLCYCAFVSKFTPLFPVVFHSLSLAHRACLPYVLFLAFYIRIYLFRSFMLLCICFTISLHSSPWFFTLSLSHVYLMSYSSPFIFVFISSIVLCYCAFVSQFHFTLPRGFSLHPSHIARFYLTALSLHYYSTWFPPTTTHAYPVLFHLHLLLFYLRSSHIPNSHNHSIYNTIQSFPFTGTHTTAPLPSLSFPHQPPISYINRAGIPRTE